MRSAFTLIELLVVVTIIVLLLAMLTPAMDRAMDAALWARCAANLHAFGLAIPQYSIDNKRKMLLQLNAYGGPYPDIARNRELTYTSQWSAERMAPYIAGVDLEGFYGPQWYCPANGKTSAKDAGNRVIASDPNNDWFAPDYAYFANVGDSYATRPEDLTGSSLNPGKLLMADTLYYWRGGGTDAWWFNHHVDGPSVHAANWGGPVRARQEVRGLSGTNQLAGDSSVSRKPGALFEPDLMWQPASSVGYVSQSPNANPAGDLNFY